MQQDIQYIPLKADKTPTVKGWQNTVAQYDFTGSHGRGMVCGSISGNIECIDVDLKYDLTGKLFEDFKAEINKVDKNLLKKLTVQKTRNNGYHLIYRCKTIEGNLKLAQRYASDIEKTKGEKIKVLLETRGEGGYIICAPTKGYEIIYGSFETIQEITPEQRTTIFNIAYSFNEVIKEFKIEKRQEKKQIKGLTPFEDYNKRGDVVYLLEKHGWKVTGEKGSKTLFLRPGESSAAHSGNFDHDKNWFSVFSTSTEFNTETGYLPYAVYAVLECRGDFSEASKRLYAEGYGDRIEVTSNYTSETPSRVALLDDDFSFLATEANYGDYLTRLRNGTFEMGKNTGFPELDKHFLFKEGDLVVVNGHDNTGKSVVMWYFSMLSNLLHGWKWIIFSSENSVGAVYRKLIEFYWCKEISLMSEKEYQTALDHVKENFKIIISDEDLYNYKDILNMSKKIMSLGEFKGLLIDPYNSLKIELTNSSKLSTHEYHYEAISEIKLFGKRQNLSIYINCHAVTNALRAKGSDGMAVAPQKADTEGGGKFANKADDFLTIHRKVQSPDEYRLTEIHVRKIKETETGGRQTPYDSPIKIRMVSGGCGFEFIEYNGHCQNPVLDFHAGVSTNSQENKEYWFNREKELELPPF